MDLRMVKTQNQIKSAFLTLCQKLTPDKIKVKDICEVAMINKTTFYNHYADSAQLSEEIYESTVNTLLVSFPEKDMIFEAPKEYILGLIGSLESHYSELKTVFRDNQDLLCTKLEKKLRDAYDQKISSFDEGVRLSFAIGGFVRVVKDYVFSNKECNIQKLTETTAQILESIAQKQTVNETN